MSIFGRTLTPSDRLKAMVLHAPKADSPTSRLVHWAWRVSGLNTERDDHGHKSLKGWRWVLAEIGVQVSRLEHEYAFLHFRYERRRR